MNKFYKILIFLSVFIISNCYVGTARDACRYYVKRDNSLEICNPEFFSIYLIPPRDSEIEKRNFGATAHLIQCLLYNEKLKDCDSDDNRYKPGFYGMNFDHGIMLYINYDRNA